MRSAYFIVTKSRSGRREGYIFIMGLRNKIAQYRAYKSGVKHCTFDPEGPGVVRVHLVPPKFSLFSSPSYLMILNGYYVLPLVYSWAVLLSAFIDSVNEFGAGELTEEETAEVFDKAVEYANGVYPDAAPEVLAADLDYILDVIFAVARGEECDAEIERLSVRAYAKHMSFFVAIYIEIKVKTFCFGRRKWLFNCAEPDRCRWQKQGGRGGAVTGSSANGSEE